MDKIKKINDHLYLNFKILVKNYWFWINSFFILLIISMVPSIFIPLNMSLGLCLSLINLLIVNVIYSSISFNWKKSTIEKNYKTTSGSKIFFNLSVLIISIFFAFLFFFAFMIVMIIYNEVGFLLETWLVQAEPGAYNFGDLKWIQLLYFSILNSTVYFFLTFALSKFFKSQKSFYLYVVSFFIITIIFGGGLNDYFDWYYTDEFGKIYVGIRSVMFPYSMFIPTEFLLPNFSSGQIMTSLSESIRIGSFDQEIQFSAFRLLPIFKGEFITRCSYLNTAVWWDINWFMSYIQIIMFALIGIFIKTKNN